MNKYSIIEDCSPYYIRFTFVGLESLVQQIQQTRPKFTAYEKNAPYLHRTYGPDDSLKILSSLPMYEDFKWKHDRVAVFSTYPNGVSSIHKDGGNGTDQAFDRVSFNIPLMVLDDQCTTSWYHDDTFNNTEVFGLPYTRKILLEKSGYNHIPKLKQMVARPNEMLLFNTDIYHSWENRSRHTREVLTMRIQSIPEIYFEDARKILFGF
jgi:hypothetical protein